MKLLHFKYPNKRIMIITYKFRLKNKNLSRLSEMARSVNFVWNYVNDTTAQYIEKKGVWISGYDACKLTAGCAKDLGLVSRVVQQVCLIHVKKRIASKKKRLKWRSWKRSLSWIPFYKGSISISNDEVKFNSFSFRFWKSREIEGLIKSGAFTQDARGRWFISVCCEAPVLEQKTNGESIGIDLGLKSIATLSNGIKLSRPNITSVWADELSKAQRARKKKKVLKIHSKISNIRKDWNHKETTKIIANSKAVYIGNVKSRILKRTSLASLVSDAGWHQFKSMLEYKARRLGVDYEEINEKFSTVTCSDCLQRTGPSGLSALGVREWICSCGSHHDRDVNAAKNILRFRHESPTKGSLLKEGADQETKVSKILPLNV